MEEPVPGTSRSSAVAMEGNPLGKIMTFHPTWEEFRDFPGYIQKMEREGAHRGGIAKVIPPPGYNPRQEGYGNLGGMVIPAPASQVFTFTGTSGCYSQANFPGKQMTVEDFRQLADSSEFRPPTGLNTEDLVRKLLSNLSFGTPPIYGAGVNGSLMDPQVDGWNIQNLGTILDLLRDVDGMEFEGINTPFLYYGMWRTCFCWHTEDKELYSINYLHFGAPKTWWAVSPSQGRKLEHAAANLFPNDKAECPAFLRHKRHWISPKLLKSHAVDADMVTQNQGEFIITFPFGYHCGFNHGFNVAESTNFAMPRWVEYGKRAEQCECIHENQVHFNMHTFVEKLQKDRFDAWINGNDWGCHPEEPGKPSYAPMPKPCAVKLGNQMESDLGVEHMEGTDADQVASSDTSSLVDEQILELHKDVLIKAGLLVDDDEVEESDDFSDPDFHPTCSVKRKPVKVKRSVVPQVVLPEKRQLTLEERKANVLLRIKKEKEPVPKKKQKEMRMKIKMSRKRVEMLPPPPPRVVPVEKKESILKILKKAEELVEQKRKDRAARQVLQEKEQQNQRKVEVATKVPEPKKELKLNSNETSYIIKQTAQIAMQGPAAKEILGMYSKYGLGNL